MGKIMNCFREWWLFVKQRSADRKYARMEREITSESEQKVQVMEMDGEIFVSFGGVPLVSVKYLNKDVADVLNGARGAYRHWRRREML